MEESIRDQEKGASVAGHVLKTSLCPSCQASGLAVFSVSVSLLPNSYACPCLRTVGRIHTHLWIRALQTMQCPQRLSGDGAVTAMDAVRGGAADPSFQGPQIVS